MSGRYRLYLESDLNRVFTGAVADLASAELAVVGRALLPDLEIDEPIADGRTSVLPFTTDADPDRLRTIVAGLSASAALFAEAIDSDDGDDRDPLLRPLPLPDVLVHADDLVTTARYRGKTNERLTRLMITTALATAGLDPAAPETDDRQRPVVLDPVCGRGTTLHWAVALGHDAIGIEPDPAALDQHAATLETWAKRHRLPHRATHHRKGNAEQRRLVLRLASDRAELKQGRGQQVQTFAADGGDRSLPIGKGSVDVIVGDLPYGIQHKGRTDRLDPPDTEELLTRLLPTWHRWLRPGGAIALAWNLKRAGRSEVTRVLRDAGFDPVVVPGTSMRHEVDHAIDRDVVIATRP